MVKLKGGFSELRTERILIHGAWLASHPLILHFERSVDLSSGHKMSSLGSRKKNTHSPMERKE
jgi:hypothetical protein